MKKLKNLHFNFNSIFKVINFGDSKKQKLMKQFTFFFFFVLFIAKSTYAQFNNFVSPVKIPIRVAGSFGELRSNHFHSGIDIKTNSRIGLPVHVVDNGYISRIKVSPWGFGYALYVNHPNGYTTVYGHLSRYAPRIDKWVKKQQYKRESFALDLTPPKTLFSVKKDEVIAYSGNSGSSGGPHLHYEIRETANQVPLNPATRGLKIEDNRNPLMKRLYVYPMDKNSCVNGQMEPVYFSLVPSKNGYAIKDNKKINAEGRIGFGLEVMDYISGSWSKCGINKAYLISLGEMKDTLFNFEIDRFHFYESRYINAHIDYSLKWNTGHVVQRFFKLPGNRLSIYRKTKNNPIVKLDKQTTTSKFMIGVEDSWKNKSVVSFSIQYMDYTKEIIQAKTDNLMLRPIEPINWGLSYTEDGGYEKGSSEEEINSTKENDHKPYYSLLESKVEEPLQYNSSHYFHDQWFTFKIDGRSLYQNTVFKGIVSSSPSAKWSPIYSFFPQDIALHRNATITFKVGEIPSSLISKAYVAKVSSNGKKFYYSGGKINKGWATFKTRSLGKFTIKIDTIPPMIRSLTLKRTKQKLNKNQGIRFVIKDLETGIGYYRGEIDGKYALFTYDGKNRLLEYKVDPTRISAGKVHYLKLKVKDNRGNYKEFKGSFVF